MSMRHVRLSNIVIVTGILAYCLIMFHFNWQNTSSFNEATGLNQLTPKQVKSISRQPKVLKNWNIKWLGHNGYLLENNGVKILLDPVYDISIKGISRAFHSFDPFSLGDIDIVVISHAHFDHLSIDTLKRLKSIHTLILPKGNSSFLKGIKVQNIVEVLSGDIIPSSIKIVVFDAQHNGSRYHPFTSTTKANSYLLDDGKSTIYFAGDTGFGEHLNKIAALHPTISILPIGAFEPKCVLNYYHMNPKQALKAFEVLNSEVLIPSHFGTYRMSLDLTSEALPMLMNYNKLKKFTVYLPQLYVPENSI